MTSEVRERVVADGGTVTRRDRNANTTDMVDDGATEPVPTGPAA